jgi:GNAT superfamily N-acetyltransferase
MVESIIRFVQKNDVKRLVELCKLHAQYENSSYSMSGKEQTLLRSLFTDIPPLYCLVAVVDHKIIGYATYMKQFSTWDTDYYIYMDCLFLIDEARGKGIGEQLIEVIKAEALKLGCNQIQWQTPDFNKRAMKFYSRIGGVSKSKERFFLNIKNS